MLEARELGDAGLVYIRERLAQGRTLSRLLLAGLNLTRGTAWAYLPPAISDRHALAFDEGGITSLATGSPPEGIPHGHQTWERVHNLADALVVDLIVRFLHETEPAGRAQEVSERVAVWEDPNAGAGDP